MNHAGNAAWGSFADLTPEAFEGRVAGLYPRWVSLFKAGCTGDAEKGGGSILFTGATSAVRGRAGALAFSSAKFATRGLASALAREVGPHGIHVAHVIVDGVIDTPGVRQRYKLSENEPLLEPDAIADTYWGISAAGTERVDV